MRTEPISQNNIKLSSLSNQPFYFSVTFSYFSRKRHVVSLPLVICYQSALWNLSCLLFKSVFLASFLNIFHQVGGEALTSYHTSFNSPRISAFPYSCQLFVTVIRVIHVLFFIFSVFLLIIYYLKKISYASSIHIMDPSCYLANSAKTSFISLVLTLAGNHKCR